MKLWHLEEELDAFLSTIQGQREKRKVNVRAVVESIRESIRGGGDETLRELSRKYDGWEEDYPLKVTPSELEEAAASVSKKDTAVLRGMIRNVTAYHKGQHGPRRTFRRKGLSEKEEFVPVEKALVYVPGGQVPYPSSLVMGAVPAKLAGVKHIYATTPTHNGRINPYIAAAALLLDIRDVYRIGGAQAIYAFSFGTETVPKVDMIVGPGNAYVEEAKRDVYGHVGIDMLAGPTELNILLTGTYPAEILAWDLFSQAEHDEVAAVGLFSPSKEDLYGIMRQVERLISSAERRQTIEKAFEANAFLAHYRKLETAVRAINAIAPEHLEVIGDESAARDILYPGIIYVGRHTCVAMGDYYIGTNHVLPTGGAGRFSAGLSVDRFTKRRVLVKIEKSFFDRYADNAIRLSRIEGLQAHGEAIKARKGLA